MRFRVTLTASTNHAHVPTEQIATWLGHFAEYTPTVEVRPFYVTASACIDAPRDDFAIAIDRVVQRLKSVFGAQPSSITVNWRTDV